MRWSAETEHLRPLAIIRARRHPSLLRGRVGACPQAVTESQLPHDKLARWT